MPRANASRTASTDIAARRLVSQHITTQRFSKPSELVAWMGAVQAQDYGAAKWAVGLRLAGSPTEAAIEHAVADGSILRTHVLRGTWQFVTPADLQWMVALVAPRLIPKFATHTGFELDAATLRRSSSVIETALRDGRHRTRAELGEALSRAGIATGGYRLLNVLAHAELELVICSGARRGKQSTYALVEHRVPDSGKPLARDGAIVELARRYFQSHGPATLGDFTWWSGLIAAEARAGLEAVQRELVSEVVAGQTYWGPDVRPAAPAASPSGLLLPAFDEYLVAYRDRAAVLDPRFVRNFNPGWGLLSPCAVVDSRVIGTWRRTVARPTAIGLAPFQRTTRKERAAIDAAARRYAAFLGVDAKTEWPAA